jgi:hypothetical protein
MTLLATSSARILTMSRAEFDAGFGKPNLAGGLCGYTREADTRTVLTLLVYARPWRVLEIGTALGHMTANLTRWTADDAEIHTIDMLQGIHSPVPWVKVREAIESLGFNEPVAHIEGTEVAFLRKQAGQAETSTGNAGNGQEGQETAGARNTSPQGVQEEYGHRWRRG